MEKFILIIAACLLAPCVGYPQEVPTLSAELQNALDKARTELNVVGVSAAVITPDEGLWLGVSGLSNKNPPEKIQERMLFCIASITKNFIATLALQLTEEAILDLADTVGDWLPDLPEQSSQWIDDAITVRQLLNHTSGIYNFLEDLTWYFVTCFLVPDKTMEPEDTLSFVKRPYFSAGEGYHYSNTNYILLGMIIEKATNSNVATELRERFFDPLGLEHTFLNREEPLSGDIAHGHLWGIDLTRFARHEARYSSLWTAGAMFSTAENIALWAQALFGGTVLNEDSLEQMRDFIDTGKLHWKRELSVGLGLMSIDHPQFGKYWYHSGLFDGYASLMSYVPDHDIVVVVLVNNYNPVNLSLVDSLVGAVVN